MYVYNYRCTHAYSNTYSFTAYMFKRTYIVHTYSSTDWFTIHEQHIHVYIRAAALTD